MLACRLAEGGAVLVCGEPRAAGERFWLSRRSLPAKIGCSTGELVGATWCPATTPAWGWVEADKSNKLVCNATSSTCVASKSAKEEGNEQYQLTSKTMPKKSPGNSPKVPPTTAPVATSLALSVPQRWCSHLLRTSRSSRRS